MLSPQKNSGGRNNSGKMTVRYIGGGNKQMYRNIDFKRTKDGIAATVKTIEYDPNRTARIALLVYADGEKSYIIAPNGLQVGQTVVSGAGVAPEVGNTLFLSEIPLEMCIRDRDWPARFVYRSVMSRNMSSGWSALLTDMSSPAFLPSATLRKMRIYASKKSSV